MKRVIILVFLISFVNLAFSQNKNRTPVFIKNTPFSLNNSEVLFYSDTTFKKDFKTIQKTDFLKFTASINDYKAKFWFKFKLSKHPLSTKLLTLLFHGDDQLEIFIPTRNGYKKYKKGLFVRNDKVKKNIREILTLTISSDSIDYKKPIYFSKIMLSNYGMNSMNKLPQIFLSDSQYVVDGIVNKKNIVNKIAIYSAVFLFSFLLFFVNYFVTKDNNYLNYSFYILFVLIIFSIQIPAGYNFLNAIHPHLYYNIEDISQVISSGFYFYFVVEFLEFKNYFTKLYRFSVYFLWSLTVLSFVIVLLNILFPHSTFRFILFSTYRVVFTIISLGIFIYLINKKLERTSKIVLLGSFLLIVGNFLTLLLHDYTIFLTNAVIEIILFSTVIAIRNNQVIKKSASNKLALEIEKNKRESLEEMSHLKNTFLANITHEFRTPLTLISSPIQRQLKKSSLSEKDKKDFNLIQRNTRRLLELVDQLLSYSKLESGEIKLKVQQKDLKRFCTRVLSDFKYLATKNGFDFKHNADCLSTEKWFSEDVLEKIFSNLLNNAIKYTSKNGFIYCEFVEKNGELHFKIQNSTTVISNNDLKQLFNRFYQIDANASGVGIGLSYVKELVKLHKGTIAVSKPTATVICFEVVIPVTKNQYNDSEQIDNHNNLIAEIFPSEIEFSIQKDATHLLIVEDNKEVQNYIGELFKENYVIHYANNGEEGIEKAKELIPDIILSDVMMPIKSGIDLCKLLKNDEKTYHIPILLISAKVGDENKYLGIDSGADDYIEKPFNNELLQLKVQKLLENIKKLQERFSQEIILQPTELAIHTVDEFFLKKIQAIIDNQLTDSDFNAEKFGKIMLMSRMQLHRKLKALFGLSATEFIQIQRLKLAKELLQKKAVSVSEVAYSVGFNNPAYFSKKFKEYYKYTPTAYKNK